MVEVKITYDNQKEAAKDLDTKTELKELRKKYKDLKFITENAIVFVVDINPEEGHKGLVAIKMQDVMDSMGDRSGCPTAVLSLNTGLRITNQSLGGYKLQFNGTEPI